jgi:integrase/recombinase XerD
MNSELEPYRTTEVVQVGLPFSTAILAGQLAPSSIAMYKRDFEAYMRFAGNPEGALDATTLARWRTVLAGDTGMSPNTINRMLSAVKRLMREAANQGYTTHETAKAFEVVDGVKVAALKDRTKQTARTRISPDDMRALTDAPNTSTLVGLRDSALLHALASSGLRASELASLTQAQIVKQNGGYTLRMRGKNDTEYRDAHLSPRAYDAIQNWLEARRVISPYIFTSFAGRGDSRATHDPMTEVAVWQTIQKYANMVGLQHAKPHDFRRFVGTQLAKQDIRKAQKALGHKRIDTTAKHYVLDELEVGLTDNLY